MYAVRGKESTLSDMGTTRCLPWGSLSLVIFLLLQPMFHFSTACSAEERAVLMDIRSSLRRAHSLVSPDLWGHDDDECCSWKTVTCSNSTRRVTHLDLSYVYASDAGDRWYLNLSAFSVFHELQSLDLSLNFPSSLSFQGTFGLQTLSKNNTYVCSFLILVVVTKTPAGHVGLPRLRYLDLSMASLGGGFLEFIGACVSLEVLALNNTNITGGLPEAGMKVYCL